MLSRKDYLLCNAKLLTSLRVFSPRALREKTLSRKDYLLCYVKLLTSLRVFPLWALREKML